MKNFRIIIALILCLFVPQGLWGQTSSSAIDNYTFTGIGYGPKLGTESQRRTLVDADGAVISSFGSISTVAHYISPGNFTASYTSGTTITLSGLPITITDDSQIVYVKVTPLSTSSDGKVYVNNSGGVTLREAANVITIYGAGATPFVTGDVYEVGLNDVPPAYDKVNDLDKVQEQSPIWERRTDVTTVVTAEDLTAAYVKQGSTIDMQGYNILQIYVATDVNDSLNVDMKLVGLHTSGGTQYEINGLNITSLWTTTVADFNEVYQFNTNGIPYVDIMAIAGTVGATAGDLTIEITKSYLSGD
jgi:hypothetical protein